MLERKKERWNEEGRDSRRPVVAPAFTISHRTTGGGTGPTGRKGLVKRITNPPLHPSLRDWRDDHVKMYIWFLAPIILPKRSVGTVICLSFKAQPNRSRHLQLDTVNTASRMKSTGIPRKIQVSQSTADCLILGGKQHRLVPRVEKVYAKGKGKVKTYFWK